MYKCIMCVSTSFCVIKICYACVYYVQVKVFDKDAYANAAKKKANAVNSFFNAAQHEKAVRNGTDSTTHPAMQSMPKQTDYRYRGHAGFTKFAEFLITMMYLRSTPNFSILALR